MPRDLERLPAAAPGAGPAALAAELLGRVRAELSAVGGLGEREQVLVSAWLTGLRWARTRRAYAEDVVAWLGWLADRDTGALAAGRVHVDLWAATQLDDGGSYLTDRPNSPARAGDSVRCGRVRGAGGLRARQIARDEHAENGDQHARGHGPQPDLDPDPPRCRPGKRCLPARGRLTPPVPASDLTPGRRGKSQIGRVAARRLSHQGTNDIWKIILLGTDHGHDGGQADRRGKTVGRHLAPPQQRSVAACVPAKVFACRGDASNRA